MIHSLRKDVETVTKIRSKNRNEDRAAMSSLRNLVSAASTKVDSTVESISTLAEMGVGLMESNRLMQTILAGEENDKKGL